MITTRCGNATCSASLRGEGFCAWSIALLLAACSGEISEPGGVFEDDLPGAGPGQPGAPGTAEPVEEGCPWEICDEMLVFERTSIPRLSHSQYDRTVGELFALAEVPTYSQSFSEDPNGTTYFRNERAILKVTPNLWQDYQVAAEQIATALVPTEAFRSRFLATPDGFVESFLLQAFRRPPTPEEVAAFRAIESQGNTLRPELPADVRGAALVVEAALQSPQFLYRIEIGQSEGKLDAYAVASRLSFALWDSMPDAELLRAAGSGELETPEGVLAQAARMLDDDKAVDTIVAFHKQLFDTADYANHTAGAVSGALLEQSALAFVSDVLVESSGSLADFLTSPSAFVDEQIAPLYGLDASSFGPTLERVELDASQRAGFFTQPGFIASRDGDTAPILRGVFLNLRLMCTDLPEPPDFDPPMFMGNTRRERINSVTGPGTCGATCHGTYINPIGYPFEAFDDDGSWRELDNRQPVDASAIFRFASGDHAFDGPVELMRLLAESQEVHFCYARNWVEYLFGRSFEVADWNTVKAVGTASREEGWSVKEIIAAIVSSQRFLSAESAEVTP